MKTMKIFSVIALLMMGAFTFTSCSDDDDNNDTAYNLALMDPEAVMKAIVGTWAFTDSYTHLGSGKTGIAVFNKNGSVGSVSFKGTYDESYNERLLWSVRQLEDGHFDFWINGVDRYQISFLSTTTFIVTYNYGLYGDDKGTITFKRIE